MFTQIEEKVENANTEASNEIKTAPKKKETVPFINKYENIKTTNSVTINKLDLLK